MSKLKIFLPFFYFSMLSPLQSYAIKLDSAYIEKLTKAYLQQQITAPDEGNLTISVSSIDPRVIIKPCDQQLTLNIPENHNSRNVNVKISCESSIPWNIFIAAKITTTLPVVVAKNYISKGSILDSSNLQVIQRDAFRIRGEFYRNIDKLLNTKTTRSMAKGKIISKNNICLVCKGERVTISTGNTNFTIRTDGLALANGTFGQYIRVKNNRSGRMISAQVVAINQVKIN